MFKLNSKKLFFPIAAIISVVVMVFFISYSLSQTANRAVLDISLSSDNYESSTKTFADRSGLGNDGISANNALFSNGKYGSVDGAMSFNGTSDYIDFGNAVNMGLNDMTIFAWVKRNSSSAGYIVTKSRAAAQTNRYWVNIQRDGVVKFGASWSNGGHIDYLGEIPLSIGEWYFITIVVDRDGYLKIFINGEFDKSYNISTYANVDVVSDNPFRIGSYTAFDNITPTGFFNGEIEEVKILNYALSDEEVKNLYDNGRPIASGSNLNKGLVGHWSMDASDYNNINSRVTDKSSFENHGTNYGATFTEDRFGKEGGAMSFDGIDDRISISYQNPVKETSVVAWFKREGPPAGGHHIITGGANIEISIPDWSGQIRTGVTTNTQSRKVFNSGSGLNDGNWHQVGMTYDGINLRSFIDGELIAINSVSGNLVGTAGEIGRYLSNSYAANGLIDDVRIYNRALSESEIQSLYDSYSPITTTGSLQKGLVLDMPLKLKYTKSETPGSQVMTDRTPYSNDGQNYGATIMDEGAFFNGAGNRINIDGVTVGDSFSMGSWAKVNNPNNSTSGEGGIISNLVHTGPTYGATITVINLNRLRVAGGDGNGDRRWKDFYPDVNFEEWNHIFTTYENGEFKVYVNGDLIGNYIKNVVQNNTPWRIGQWASSYGSYYYHGVLSGAKVYNRALSEEEVKTLYDRGRSDAGIIFQEN